MQLRCLALFDWPPSVDDREIIRAGFDWFRSKSPSLGKTYVANSYSSKSKSISRAKLIEKIENREVIAALEIYPNGPDDFSRNFCVSGGESGKRILIVTLPAEQFHADEAEDLITSLASIGNMAYGICLTTNGAKNPAFYVRGVTHGEIKTKEDADQADLDSIWFMERLSMKGAPPKMRHKLGFFKDVYEINVINENHARAMVDGQDLVSWIGESRVRGTVKRISSSNLLWTIPVTCIRHIRESLSKNGLLLSSA